MSDEKNVLASHSTQRELTSQEPGGEATSDGFIKVSKIYIDEMNDLAQQSPSAHRVLWTLIKEMKAQNGNWSKS